MLPIRLRHVLYYERTDNGCWFMIGHLSWAYRIPAPGVTGPNGPNQTTSNPDSVIKKLKSHFIYGKLFCVRGANPRASVCCRPWVRVRGANPRASVCCRPRVRVRGANPRVSVCCRPCVRVRGANPRASVCCRPCVRVRAHGVLRRTVAQQVDRHLCKGQSLGDLRPLSLVS